ncbi:uncharacterized protein TNCV_1061891 [Trichonephila clavipes]|nr:uncharacterized protein TNCV_1061891 [Trichonephila clavipes]
MLLRDRKDLLLEDPYSSLVQNPCLTCNPNSSQRTVVATIHINAYTAQARSLRLTLIDITFCGIKGRVCAGTGSSHSIAGEKMYQAFKYKGLIFQETTLAKEKLKHLLESFQNVVEPREEAPTILEHHTSDLTPCNGDTVKPLISLRKRGRPPKAPLTPGSLSEPKGEDVTKVRVEVDMPLRRFRRQYEQLSQFERQRISDMIEARGVARQIGCTDCVVKRGYWDQWIREKLFTR